MASVPAQAVTRSVRSAIEAMLPWYHPADEQARNARTERIARRSVLARMRAQRVIVDYRRAEEVASRAGDRTAEFRDAQESVKEAGERLIEEIEKSS